MHYDVAVIGAGPAGIFAAGCAAEKGAKTLLVEKNPSIGKKLLITGKGRCNLTNSGGIKDFIANINNGKFLYQAFNRYFNEDLIKFFESRKVPLKVERGGRVFPVSDESRDVVLALSGYLSDAGVTLMPGKKAERILLMSGKAGTAEVSGVLLAGEEEPVKAGRVIVATGGLSYPGTGSTGDGYKMARELGHAVTRCLPALVQLRAREKFTGILAGLSLKNIEVAAFADGREIFREFGEMLFTHGGVSGPVILSLSGTASEHLAEGKKVHISINLKPALDREKLDARLLRELDSSGLKTIANILKTLLPQSLIPVFLELSGIDPAKKGSQINRKEREAIYGLLTGFKLEISGSGGYDEAIITKGGIKLKEIEPRTMASKLIQGLYFCGEVLDIDGYTGGYNLQAAFSTGYLAGESAAQGLAKENRN